MDVESQTTMEMDDSTKHAHEEEPFSEQQYLRDVKVFNEMLEKLKFGRIEDSERPEFGIELRAMMAKIRKGMSDRIFASMINKCSSMNIS